MVGSAYTTVNNIVSVANLTELTVYWKTALKVFWQARFKSDNLTTPEAGGKLHLHKCRRYLAPGERLLNFVQPLMKR